MNALPYSKGLKRGTADIVMFASVNITFHTQINLDIGVFKHQSLYNITPV